MKYKVVYFTRTKTSKRVAEKIGKGLSCDVIEIKDDMKWNGIIGFIKGGYYASKDKPVNISLSSNVGDYDEIIVVSPLWAGGSAPAIRTFLKDVQLDKVHMVITSNGSKTKTREMYKSITDIVRSQNNEDDLVNQMISGLSK